MSNTLDFNNYKKKYMTVILPNKEKTTLFISSPTNKLRKEVVDMFKRIQELKGVSDFELAQTTLIDELYQLCVSLMSRNQNNIEVTREWIESILDYEDLNVFLLEYMRYLIGIQTEKN